jgi:hypothetical protein
LASWQLCVRPFTLYCSEYTAATAVISSAALVAGGYGDCPVVGSDTETTVSLDEGFQKASVAADETGTETAGATGVVGVVTTSYEEPELNPFTMKVDRPFLFALRDRETGPCSFSGRSSTPPRRSKGSTTNERPTEEPNALWRTPFQYS